MQKLAAIALAFTIMAPLTLFPTTSHAWGYYGHRGYYGYYGHHGYYGRYHHGYRHYGYGRRYGGYHRW